MFQIGQAVTNGAELHCMKFNWQERLTIIKSVPGYGVSRYIVADRSGRRGYAY